MPNFLGREQLQAALILAIGILALQAIQLLTAYLGRQRAKLVGAAITNAVVQHAEKLKENTELTKDASQKATAAYVEANNFNRRLQELEEKLTTKIETEFIGIRASIHSIRNVLVRIMAEQDKRDNSGPES